MLKRIGILIQDLFKVLELVEIMTQNNSDECFLLHQRSYGETSLIADVFTKKNGKMSLIAKGAKKPKSKFFGYLVPFHKLSCL